MKPGENPIETLAATFTGLWFDQATDPDRVNARNKWAEMLLSERAKLTDLIDATERRFRDELNIAPPHAFFLYIDQGEELFSRATKPTTECFSRLAANGLDDERLIVMTSLRSDYYEHPKFGFRPRILLAATTILPPPSVARVRLG
jgi:hypothetical protein